MLDELDKMLKDDEPQAKFPAAGFNRGIVIPDLALDGTYGSATTYAPPMPAMTKESIDAAIAMIKEPMSLGVSSRGYSNDPSFYDDYNYAPVEESLAQELSKQMAIDLDKTIMVDIAAASGNMWGTAIKPVNSLKEAEEICAQVEEQKITMAYDPSIYSDYSAMMQYDYKSASPAMGDMQLTVANSVPDNTIRIQAANGNRIDINTDGSIDVSGGANLNADAVAIQFWDAVSDHAPENTAIINRLKEDVSEITALNQFQETVIAELKAKLSDYEAAPAMKSDKSSLARVSQDRLVNFIKNNVSSIARDFVFEPNDTSTRTQIRWMVNNFLDSVIERDGITDYAVVCDETNNSPERIDNGNLCLDVTVKPMNSTEFIYIPVAIKASGVDLIEEESNQKDAGYLYAPYIPQTVTNGYDPYSLTEDFINPQRPAARGSLVETLPSGQGLGELEDLEYFRRKVTDAMKLPDSYFEGDIKYAKAREVRKALLQHEVLLSQLETKPSIVVDAASSVGKMLVKKLRSDQFDDSMELVK